MSDLDTMLADIPADPYPLYDTLRSRDRMLWREGADRWLVTGHGEALAVLRHEKVSSDRTRWDGYRPPTGYDRGVGMSTMDPPHHTRLRGLVQRAFTPRVVQQLRPRIEELVDDLLTAAAERGTIDLMTDLAGPLPATVLAELLGIPAADQENFHQWATTMIAAIDPASHAVSADRAEAGQRADTKMSGYLTEIIGRRRDEPREDLISALVRAEEDGERLTGDELLDMCILLTVAGLETTVHLIGNGVNALLEHPDQLAGLRSDPAPTASAIEELLRYAAPIQAERRNTPHVRGFVSLPVALD